MTLSPTQDHVSVLTHLESRPVDQNNRVDYFLQFSSLSCDISVESLIALLQQCAISVSLVRYVNEHK